MCATGKTKVRRSALFSVFLRGVNIPGLVAAVKMPIILPVHSMARQPFSPSAPPPPPTKMTVLSVAHSHGFLLRSRCSVPLARSLAPSFVDGDGDTVSTRESLDLKGSKGCTRVQSHAMRAFLEAHETLVQFCVLPPLDAPFYYSIHVRYGSNV